VEFVLTPRLLLGVGITGYVAYFPLSSRRRNERLNKMRFLVGRDREAEVMNNLEFDVQKAPIVGFDIMNGVLLHGAYIRAVPSFASIAVRRELYRGAFPLYTLSFSILDRLYRPQDLHYDKWMVADGVEKI